MSNPLGHSNGVEIAASFTLVCGRILAWLWIIMLPFVKRRGGGREGGSSPA